MAPALHLLKKIGGYRNEDRRNEKRSEADNQRLRCRGAFEPGSGQKEKKGLGGPRNPLKSLNSDKENKVNSFDFLGWAWLDLARFGFASENPNPRARREYLGAMSTARLPGAPTRCSDELAELQNGAPIAQR
jgi:hypothetical protein